MIIMNSARLQPWEKGKIKSISEIPLLWRGGEAGVVDTIRYPMI
jgi:hypothetical protein